MLIKKVVSFWLLVVIVFFSKAQTKYQNPVFNHDFPDPNLIETADGYFYAYSTQANWTKEKFGGKYVIPILKSKDLVHWQVVGDALAKKPDWKPEGGIWAPDAVYYNNKYYLYYSFSTWGDPNPGIGVATSLTPEGPFTDHGKLFLSKEIGVDNSIDAFLFEDEGKPYLVWGSFHGIYAVELSSDGLKIKGDKFKIGGTAYEGSYIYKRGKYYYYLGSTGTCCEGAKSTYQVNVARATSFKGPYADKDGKSLLENGGTPLLRGNPREGGFVGPGHNGDIVEDEEGTTWMVYHGFDKKDPVRRVMLLDKITWENDWPEIKNHQPTYDQVTGPMFSTPTVSFKILDDETGAPVHSNIRLRNAAGQSLYPDSTYFWKTFYGAPFPDYPNDGEFSIQLPAGKYFYEVDRGPEYYLSTDSFQVNNEDFVIALRLKRIADLKKMNWWSGELHTHRKLKDIEMLMKCSDLHIAPVITSWNEHYYVKPDSVYDATPVQFDDNRFYTTSGSEDERSGGAILVLNSPKPIDFSQDYKPEFPPLASSVERAAKLSGENFWIDLDKPYWWDVPILLATGKINSVGIANNHMNQDGIMNNEAWGRARDTAKYPSPRGNGLYAQDVYYHMLNAGIKIAPSAGSASGVLMNPVGYNRIYAYVEGGLTYDKWFESVKEERTFITNGPLLVCRVNNKYPGEIFTAAKSIKLNISMGVFSRDTIDVIEIIKNGKLYKKIPANEIRDNRFSGEISFDKSGWFLVRVICKKTGNFRFASTAPYRVNIGNKEYISKASAQYFLNWVNQRARSIKVSDPKQSADIMKYIAAARKFWQDKIESATAE